MSRHQSYQHPDFPVGPEFLLQEEPSESSLLEEDNDSLEMDKFEKSD